MASGVPSVLEVAVARQMAAGVGTARAVAAVAMAGARAGIVVSAKEAGSEVVAMGCTHGTRHSCPE